MTFVIIPNRIIQIINTNIKKIKCIWAPLNNKFIKIRKNVCV